MEKTAAAAPSDEVGSEGVELLRVNTTESQFKEVQHVLAIRVTTCS